MINRREFGRLFAETYGVTYQTADKMCRQAFELLGNLLFEQSEDVVISGFGSFRHKVAKPTVFRHPKTGEIVQIPEKTYVKFVPSEVLEAKAD